MVIRFLEVHRFWPFVHALLFFSPQDAVNSVSKPRANDTPVFVGSSWEEESTGENFFIVNVSSDVTTATFCQVKLTGVSIDQSSGVVRDQR